MLKIDYELLKSEVQLKINEADYKKRLSLFHDSKHYRVKQLPYLFLAQLIKLNSHLANEVGVEAIIYNYYYNNEEDKAYIFCEEKSEIKNTIKVPYYRNSIEGYKEIKALATGNNGEEVALQAYLKQTLFALFIGDIDRNDSNIKGYYDDNDVFCLYPMYDFDQCFSLSSWEYKALKNEWYINGDIEDFWPVLSLVVNQVQNHDYLFSLVDGYEYDSQLGKEVPQRHINYQTLFAFCYEHLADKEFITGLLEYNLEDLFNIDDNHGFNANTKLLYLSLMEVQREKMRKALNQGKIKGI